MNMRGLKFAIAAALCLASAPALAQSNPNLKNKQVPTAVQWNSYFSAKQDVLGYVPLNTTGGVMSGRLITAAPGASTSGLNLTPGTTPASPANGDLWVTSGGFFARVNGVTIGPLGGASASSFAATSPLTVSFPAGVTTYALNLSVANTWLAQQTNQGATGTSPGWYSQITGDTFARVRVGLNASDVSSIAFGPGNLARDAFIERVGAGSLRFGTSDAASPVAQTFGVQGVLAGTSNTAGAAFTLAGSRGTGTGAGGSLIFQTAPAGGSGSTQNALATALTIFGTGGLSTGAATDQGAGTLNLAGSLYNNGTAPSGTGAYVRTASPTLSGNITMTLGSDATGDVFYRNSSGFITRLPIGSTSAVLTVAGGLPSWAAATGGGNVSTSGTPAAFQTPVWASSTTIKGIGPGTLGQQYVSNGAGVDPSFTSGGWVLLNTLTASASASLSDTTSLTASYNEYEIVFSNILPATNGTQCRLLVHSGGSFPATNYSSPGIGFAASSVVANTGTGAITCSNSNSADVGNTVAGGGVSGSFRVSNPSNTTNYKTWYGTVGTGNTGGTVTGALNVGQWIGGTGAVDGFQVSFNTGNIVSGTIKVYGRL